MTRDDNITIFEDTKRLFESDPVLVRAVKHSQAHQKVILETDPFPGVSPRYDKPANIIVTPKRTFEAAQAYQGQQVCVLNFASARHPGGGVVRGTFAQEESLCRCSTLYPCLTSQTVWEPFYGAHRKQKDQRYNDDCIYTPDVVVFKSDTRQPRFLPKTAWWKTNVITCAAPNLRTDREGYIPVSDEELYQIHARRMRRILDIATENRNEVMILGAYGCGAFQNPPEVVASALNQAVKEYRHHFRTIEFAIYCSPRDKRNYEVFQQIIGGHNG